MIWCALNCFSNTPSPFDLTHAQTCSLDQVNTEVMLSQMEGLLDRVPGQAIASGIPWSKLTQDRLDLHYALNTARSTSSRRCQSPQS